MICRYFLILAYRGTAFCGWQRQPNGFSVQEALETALATLLRRPTEVVGCGRTDAGVHARYYVAHFDGPDSLPEPFLFRLNGILPDDISVYQCTAVAPEAHARFDAILRGYVYHITTVKDPFLKGLAWCLPTGKGISLEKLNETAALFTQFDAFYPFCKTNSGNDHYRCTVTTSEWRREGNALLFTVEANRFLRGMVRLMVGACVQVAMGKIPLSAVKTALETQQMLEKSLSAPAEGLFLTRVDYPVELGITA